MAGFADKAIAGSQTSHQHRGESCPSAFVLNLLSYQIIWLQLNLALLSRLLLINLSLSECSGKFDTTSLLNQQKTVLSGFACKCIQDLSYNAKVWSHSKHHKSLVIYNHLISALKQLWAEKARVTSHKYYLLMRIERNYNEITPVLEAI